MENENRCPATLGFINNCGLFDEIFAAAVQVTGDHMLPKQTKGSNS